MRSLLTAGLLALIVTATSGFGDSLERASEDSAVSTVAVLGVAGGGGVRSGAVMCWFCQLISDQQTHPVTGELVNVSAYACVIDLGGLQQCSASFAHWEQDPMGVWRFTSSCWTQGPACEGELCEVESVVAASDADL
jgi:hypothetical protein